ncbi:hypothetical protein SAMN04490188_3900 [Pseudomonas kilonensis]|uniref:Uncharacterized protein n=1 Tax=Pseudomonas kilonensis TaxID=132476 RepID=A0ABY0Z9A7_9PSED|nr:hypothetical protein SAMN04490188_3900 [Pseudomonas kilonensis]
MKRRKHTSEPINPKYFHQKSEDQHTEQGKQKLNYIVVHKPSQLIKTVVTSSKVPTPDIVHSFHAASSIVLDRYYKLANKARRTGVLVNVGDLAAISPSFLESLADSNRRQR